MLNTRDARGAPALTRLLEERGAAVVECPTLVFEAPESWQPFDARLEQITSDDWVVFTSANAVRATLERLWELNRPPAVLNRARIAAIGRSTAAVLEQSHLAVALVPPVAQQESLLGALREVLRPSDKVWIPRAQDAREVLVEGLRAESVPVSVTPVYRTLAARSAPRPALEALGSGRIDWVVFTSPSTVSNFLELLDEDSLAGLRQRWPRVACIGAVTAEAARDRGLDVAVVPARQDLEGMVDAIAAHVAGGPAPG